MEADMADSQDTPTLTETKPGAPAAAIALLDAQDHIGRGQAFIEAVIMATEALADRREQGALMRVLVAAQTELQAADARIEEAKSGVA
jgi:hypothetical protein